MTNTDTIHTANVSKTHPKFDPETYANVISIEDVIETYRKFDPEAYGVENDGKDIALYFASKLTAISVDRLMEMIARRGMCDGKE